MEFYEMVAWAAIASFGGMAVIGMALYGIGCAFMNKIENNKNEME